MRTTNRILVVALVALAFTVIGAPRAAAEDGATLAALELAWNRELNAQLHYTAFAAAAGREGHARIANLFCAVARAEEIHAASHLFQIERLDGVARRRIESVVVRSTAENLARAIELEKQEWADVYPVFADRARREHKYDALAAFNWARSAEKTHADIFGAALEDLRRNAPGSRFLVSLSPVALPDRPVAVGPVALICPGCGSAYPAPPGRSCGNCGTSCSKLLEPDCER